MKLNDVQLSAVNYDKGNSVVFASAGAGKTTVLVARLLKRITKDRISLNEIIAMTFTENAASNMKKRLEVELNKEIAKGEDIDYLKSQLALISDSKISTIHSFCLSIVKDYYYLCDISPIALTNIIDDTKAKMVKDELLNDVIDNYLKVNEEKFIEISNLLSSEIFSNDSFKSDILYLSKTMDNHIAPIEFVDKYLNYYKNNENINNEQIISKYLDILKDKLKDIIYLYRDLNNYLDEINDTINVKCDELEELLNIDDYNLFINELEFRLKVPKTVKKNDLFNLKRDELCITISELVECLLHPKDILNRGLKANEILFELLTIAKEYYLAYANYKRANNYLDFNDFEHYAYKILTYNDNEIAKKLKNQYKEIMIDEFQDTNDIQFNIASLIANNNLFIVGDIKQSIYRFRNANPSIMNSLSNNTSFKRIDIQNNYRSKKNLVDFNNELFTKVMNLKTEAFKGLDAQITTEDYQMSDNVDVTFDLYTYEEKKETDEKIKASLLAKRIISLYNEGIKFKDICVLVRTHAEKIMIKRIFEEKNIPYFINDNKGYFNSFSIEVLLAYISILLDKTDKISLISVLQAIYNLDDNDITKLNLDDISSIKPFYDDYLILKEYVLNNDFSSFFKYFLSIDNFYLDILNDDERANIDLIVSKLNDYEVSSFAYLKSFIESVIDEQNEVAISVNDEADVVKVMTIHTSKGLEFDNVILYSNTKYLFSENRENITFDDEVGFGIKFNNSKYRDGIFNLERVLIKEKNNLEDLFEYVRLLYVAATRSKKRFYIVDAFKDASFALNDRLLTSRKGFTSLILAAMYTSPLLKINKIENYEVDALKSETRSLKQRFKKYDFNYSEKEDITPSSLETHNLQLSFKENLGTKYGDLMHKMMENVDFNNIDLSNYDIDDNSKQRIINLINNDFFKTLIKDNYYREYPFYYLDHNKLIHGFIDFISFGDEITIIDYKTDSLKDDEEFIKRYANQLLTYQKVINDNFNKKTNVYIYSFHNEKFIKLA